MVRKRLDFAAGNEMSEDGFLAACTDHWTRPTLPVPPGQHIPVFAVSIHSSMCMNWVGILHGWKKVGFCSWEQKTAEISEMGFLTACANRWTRWTLPVPLTSTFAACTSPNLCMHWVGILHGWKKVGFCSWAMSS